MKIKKMGSFLDGGTVAVTTEEKVYCIDNRVHTTTRGSVYEGYPKKDGSNLAPDQYNLKQNINDAVKIYADKPSTRGIEWDVMVEELMFNESE